MRELISCLERMNLEYLYYQKKLCFLNSMMSCANSVIVSVMKVFTCTVEYSKLCDFACVSSYDSRARIRRCVAAKYTASIVH